MKTDKSFFLQSREIFKISGSDALNFLNRLVTADLKELKDGSFIFSALLNSKGRFMFDFFIHLINGEIFLDINKNVAESFIKNVKYYDLLDEIKIEKQSLKVFADESFLQNWKSGQFHGRFLLNNYEGDIFLEEEFNKRRIMLCLPDGALELRPEKSVIMDFGYEEAGAISFTKGCYIGQELITRTKRVGEVRKAICCIKTGYNKIKRLSSFDGYSLILCYKEDILGKSEITLDGRDFEIISTSFSA